MKSNDGLIDLTILNKSEWELKYEVMILLRSCNKLKTTQH